MRPTLWIAGFSVLALLVLAYVFPSDPDAEVDLQRTRGGRSSRDLAPPPGLPFDPHAVRGSEIYIPYRRTISGADAEITYPALLLWFGELHHFGVNRFAVRDARVILNREPRTDAEWQSLATIDPGLAPSLTGDAMLRLMEGHSHIRAPDAVLTGSDDLRQLQLAELTGGVTALLVAGRPPGTRSLIETPAMALVFDEGSPTLATGTGPVRYMGPLGEARGEGFRYEFASGSLTVLSEVHATLLDPRHPERPDAVLEIEAAGPLVLLPRAVGEPRGTVTLAGPVRLTSSVDGLGFRGDRLEATVGGEPARLERAVLEGHVVGEDRALSVAGDRLLIEGQGADAVARVTGSPAVIHVLEVASMFPGSRGRGDLLLRTAGAVSVGSGAESPGSLSVVAGPEVHLEVGTFEAETGEVHLELARVPWGEAGNLRLSPRRIDLLRGVRGAGPDGRFEVEQVSLTREPADHEGPARERAVITGPARILWEVVGGAVDAGRPERPEALLAGPGVVEIQAADRIELVRDALALGPLTVVAHGHVSIERRPREGALADLLLHARRVDLSFVPVVVPSEPDLVGSEVRRRWELSSLVAEEDVVARQADRLQATGSRLEWRPPAGSLWLSGLAPGPPAEVSIRDGKGREDRVAAPGIRLESGIGRIATEGHTEAAVMAPSLLAWRLGPGAIAPDVLTTIRSDKLEAEVDAERRRILALNADLGVEVRQEGLFATCRHLELDVPAREIIARGAPARIELGDGDREYLEAGRIAVVGREALLETDVRARFRAPAAALATTPPPRARAPGSEPEAPVEIVAGESLALTSTALVARGRPRLTQGEPDAGGFLLEADVLSVFPERGTQNGLQGILHVVRAVAEGDVIYRSARAVARGATMIFDRAGRRVTLLGGGADASLTLAGRIMLPRPRFDVDFSDPGSPALISVLPPDEESP